ncbi:hypothetical protein V1504DRAFT_462758 [Lipomyces starkeyi]
MIPLQTPSCGVDQPYVGFNHRVPPEGGRLGCLYWCWRRCRTLARQSLRFRVVGIDGEQAKRDPCLVVGCEAVADFTQVQSIPHVIFKITSGKGLTGFLSGRSSLVT